MEAEKLKELEKMQKKIKKAIDLCVKNTDLEFIDIRCSWHDNKISVIAVINENGEKKIII